MEDTNIVFQVKKFVNIQKTMVAQFFLRKS